MNPQDLLYTKTHEWARVETSSAGEKIATVGITTFAYELLTDLVFVALPEVGRTAQAETPVGEIESVKAVSDFNSPVDGEVVEVNAEVPNNLDKLSQDPYGRWWFMKIKITDETCLKNLMDAAAYEKQCAEEHS
ncbi:MAG: glycine cleavage system protein GcvH [Pirellulales bacterium]|nr:glycine cleavage system protein GcvH [Pirellulales bacterium]